MVRRCQTIRQFTLPALDGCGVRAAVSALVISARSTAGTLHGAGNRWVHFTAAQSQVLSRCRVWITTLPGCADIAEMPGVSRELPTLSDFPPAVNETSPRPLSVRSQSPPNSVYRDVLRAVERVV